MSNRNLAVVVVVLLSALAGVVVWQTGPVNAAGEPTVPQEERRGVYRGTKTAERFDVSPPLTTLKGFYVDRDMSEGKEEKKTGYEQRPFGAQDVDRLVQGSLGPQAIRGFDDPVPVSRYGSWLRPRT